jgi:hypothetical protein
VALLLAWRSGATEATALVVLAGSLGLWALFLAPAWCGAANRQTGEFCRNNSWGLLLGCHIRQHKWQKFKMLFLERRWGQLTRGLWSSPGAALATISGLISIYTFVAAPLLR